MSVHTKPTVNILYAPGTNSHKETAWAFERVGAQPHVVMMSTLLAGDRQLDDADLLCIPGGFTYGDHVGAGAIAGLFLRTKLAEQLERARTKPIIAICNGFQIAVRAGLFGDGVSLTVNKSGTFRNIMRQRHRVEDVDTPWLAGLAGQELRFPCAHGEGRLQFTQQAGWQRALSYPEGTNPDGSAGDIAGIVTDDGLVFGLMNHPERWQDGPGNLDLFANGVKAAA